MFVRRNGKKLPSKKGTADPLRTDHLLGNKDLFILTRSFLTSNNRDNFSGTPLQTKTEI
jgi:hypothetical protein